VDLQLGIIDLQCDSDLKTKFVLASLSTFYQFLFPGYQWRSVAKCLILGEWHYFVRKKKLSKHKTTVF